MNIYRHEMRANRKSLIYWCIGAFLLIATGVGKYSALSASEQSASALISHMPRLFRIIIGVGDFDITTPLGFFGVLYIYLVLMAAIHAAMLGDQIIAKEERDKTAEFLLVKPVSRTNIITAKLWAALTNILVYSLVNWGASIFLIRTLTGESGITAGITRMTAGMLLLQLIFLFLGTALAASHRGVEKSASTITVILIGTFMLSILIDLESRLKVLKVLTPFKYFPAADLILKGSLNTGYIIWSWVLILGFISLTYFSYRDKEINL
ncbi:MAG: ABC transporter permease subunit [Methylocystaceae bacterium]